MRVRFHGLLLAALVALPVLFAGQATAQSSAEILDRLRTAIESTDALRATFSQQMGPQVIEGTVVLSGDRYRVELPGQTLVSDGTTAWAHSHDDNQVLINHHLEEAGGFTPGTFFTTYPEHFRAQVNGSETLRGARHHVLRLVPHTANDYVREVTMYVRASDHLPTRVRILDGHGQALVFELQNIERNPRLESGTFAFRPPSGAEVIDLRR